MTTLRTSIASELARKLNVVLDDNARVHIPFLSIAMNEFDGARN